MSVVAILSLFVDILPKTIAIGRHIVGNYKDFQENKDNVEYRLNRQVSRLEKYIEYFSDSRIVRNIKPHDNYSFVYIIKTIHGLFVRYVQKSSPNDPLAKTVVNQNSVEEFFRKIEGLDDHILDPTPAQQVSWLTLQKRKLSWAFHKKDTSEKLVSQVEFWVLEFESLCADTIPQIMTRVKISSSDIMQMDAGNDINGTKAKGQLLVTIRDDINNGSRNVASSLVWAHKDTFLEYSHLRFIDQAEETGEEQGNSGHGNLGGRKRRQWAQLLDECGNIKEPLVIVEFKERPFGNRNAVDQVLKQLRSLVAILRIAAKDTPTFQILYCHGFYETRSLYGLVYQLPPSTINPRAMQCESLTSILGTQNYLQQLAANLQNRIDLAKALAFSMFHLHSVQWLHKSFNPDNILFFGRKSSKGITFHWDSPYIVGFDASRNIRDESQMLPTTEAWEERVYIHPERQKQHHPRFQKIFDIYSLGVVLLEIGLLTSFKSTEYKESGWPNLPATQVRQRLIDRAGELKKIMGITYEKIVIKCLQGEFDVVDEDADETQLSDIFRTQVCEKFQQIYY